MTQCNRITRNQVNQLGQLHVCMQYKHHLGHLVNACMVVLTTIALQIMYIPLIPIGCPYIYNYRSSLNVHSRTSNGYNTTDARTAELPPPPFNCNSILFALTAFHINIVYKYNYSYRVHVCIVYHTVTSLKRLTQSEFVDT